MRENVGDGLHVEREAAYGLWAYEGGIETESKRADCTFRSVRGVNRQFHQKLNPQNPPSLPGGRSVSPIVAVSVTVVLAVTVTFSISVF